VSLSAHLTTGSAEHGRLAFHPDCPRCRSERLGGSLSADALASRRAQAALAVGVLTFSAAAPPAVAQVGETDQEQEGVAPPHVDEPGLEPEFDPGGDDTLDVETGPIQGGPEAGGQEDDGQGAPVETEPVVDPDAPVVLEDAPDSQPPAPQPIPAPAPTPEPPVPAPPVGPHIQPPPSDVDQATPSPQPPKTPTKRDAKDRRSSPRKSEHRVEARSVQAPPSDIAAPVVEPSATTDTATVASPEPSEPADAPIRGRSYTVQAGDSLWSIAKRLLGPDTSTGRVAREVDRLWRLNSQRIGTGNPSLIHVGTMLRLR